MANLYGSVTTPWLIRDPEKSKYEGIFESLGPVGGKLPGDKVKPLFECLIFMLWYTPPGLWNFLCGKRFQNHFKLTKVASLKYIMCNESAKEQN